MNRQPKCGILVLDRKAEYIEDTLDQRGNRVFGLQNHPNAGSKMVVVSMRTTFANMKRSGHIFDHLQPRFNIQDIEPIDLADFLTGLTPQQEDLIRDYAHEADFYSNLLAETQFGEVNKSQWYTRFPGLFDLKEPGKKLIKQFEQEASGDGRTELTNDEHMKLADHLTGEKPKVLERVARRIKRFCNNPFFGGSHRGPRILEAPSCVEQIVGHLDQGRSVFIDMRGRDDEDYTLVAALFARRLLNLNKERDDKNQVHACLVMEEAQNILSEDEVKKGLERGSVFVELAREGRSYKLGFVLVTQQPDPQSIATQVAKTIDTIVAFNMPPEDAKHLRRLKAGFADLELTIANAAEFNGIAISAEGGAISFRSGPVDPAFMDACVTGSLEDLIEERGESEFNDLVELGPIEVPTTTEERLAKLVRQRQESIQPIALATMRVWRSEASTESDSDGSLEF